MGESQYITFPEFEETLEEYFRGDRTQIQQVVKLGADVSGHRESIYFPKKWNLKTKADTPYKKFRAGLVNLGQEALVIFLCERHPCKRVRIPKSAVSIKDRITLTPADDVRLTNQLERELLAAVGKDDFDIAREELIRLYTNLPEDGSGQMQRQAMDLVINSTQIQQVNRLIQSYLTDSSGRPIKNSDGTQRTPPDKLWGRLKELRGTLEKRMKTLGLTAEDIDKRRKDGTQGLHRAAEALAERLDEALPTANLEADAKEFLEIAQESYTPPEDSEEMPDGDVIDEIDLTLIHEPAPDATER
ncbi:MAG: hypothetical protein JW885_02885 [Deltaproteobacteria bacterium]|nr:hypothetical protein [Candidatus Zymogenaceae bacterium]